MTETEPEPVDTVIHGTLVEVHTGTLTDGAVAIDDGTIVALEDRPAKQTLETEYIAPGLIDAHMHVESSMVTVPHYGEAVVPRGVTAIVTDPHEIGNVLGEAGVRSMLADAKKTPLKARFTVPSSVPATDLQDAGAAIDPDAVERLLDAEDVVALGEVMNIPAVVAGEADIHAKIQAARDRGLTVDGHLPQVSGSALQTAARYLDTDHESISLEEAREKTHAGITVSLREGSSSKNVVDLLPLLEEVDSRRLTLCTDDRDVTELVDSGGIDSVVRTVIAEGVDPVRAVQLATINTAECYGLPFGRLEPGAPADLALLSDLETWAVDHVLVDGVLDPTVSDTATTEVAADTVVCEPVTPAALAHQVSASGERATQEGDGDRNRNRDQVRVRVIDAFGGIQTAASEADVPVESGRLVADTDADVLPLAAIERHDGNGGIGTGFVHGFGLERGAIASTVAHDAHNLVVVGTTHEAMATAANHVREVGGGIAVYDPDSAELTALPLPIAGLLSDQPLETVANRFRAVERAATAIGLPEQGLMKLSFVALEVIPELRLTNNGLVDVTAQEYVSVVI